MTSAPLNPTEFANLVNSITSAFGDPTRRDIYLLAHENQDGLTVSEVAEATGIHTNVARHHLDKLAGGGYLEVSQRSSSGAGRPAKVYSATDTELHLQQTVRHDDILVALLGKALGRLPAAEAAELAEEVGYQFGLQLAADNPAPKKSFRSALHMVADALSANGFVSHAEKDGDELRIVSSHCPFGDVAIEHPVICAVDRGMVKGLLSPLFAETEVELGKSMAYGDEICTTDVAIAAD